MLKQQNFFDRNIPAWKQVLFLSWPTIGSRQDLCAKLFAGSG